MRSSCGLGRSVDACICTGGKPAVFVDTGWFALPFFKFPGKFTLNNNFASAP
jgi:hypothetical protein